MLFGRRDDCQIAAIVERVRSVVSRQPGRDLCISADSLKLPALDLARLLSGEATNRELVIDAITALVHEFGIDPQWLLTGEYDGAVHRHVLLLGEDRTGKGRSAVRDFVNEQYRRLRRDAMFAWWPLGKSGRNSKARSTSRRKSA